MKEILVDVEGVSKSFGKDLPLALDNISGKIPKGEIVGLAGPDGTGKTTLMRLMAGLLKPTQGKIAVGGFDTIQNAENLHRIVGYMPQKFGLYEDLTVKQNLNLYADLTGVLGEERQQAYTKLLEFTGLVPFVDRLAGRLSGGMKQKLGLACALIRKPTLLLLDEPSVGVDPISRRELWKMVYNLLEQGISVVWSTAYLDEAERCHTVILLNEGKSLFVGPPREMTQRLKDRTFLLTGIHQNQRQILIQALRQSNVLDGVIQGTDVRVVSRNSSKEPLNLKEIKGESDLKIIPTPPRFEDAFVDILGGGPGGYSLLADKTPKIMEKREDIVKAEGLTKKFGDFVAANDVTFTVRSGEVFGLLGPNGAGKSTTFKMMCGLLKPTSGKAFVNGLNLQIASGEARSHIGYMAQKFSLYGNLSVKQNLDFFSGIYNLEGKQRSEAVNQMIEIFDLKPYLDESADGLPLGFKQRLALSCSVMHRPSVLFLDEPTAGVDPITRREFWNHINGLVNKGITVIVTTHFLDEAEFCDRIGLIYQSHLIEMGSPEELKAKAINKDNPSPTLEDAFVYLIEQYEHRGSNG